MLNVGLVAPITLDVVQATPPPSHFHGVRVADPAMPAKPCVAGSIPAGGTTVNAMKRDLLGGYPSPTLRYRRGRDGGSILDGSAIGRNVRGDQDAGARRGAVRQPESLPRAPIAKEPLPTADHQRVDHQGVRVDQILLHQRLGELATADHHEVLAVLRLELADLLG